VKLWTLITPENYDLLKSNQLVLATPPNNIMKETQDWFLSITKFKNWPVWTYLNNPNKDTIANFCQEQEITSENQPMGFLLELNITNNEKMAFFSDCAWEYIKNYLYLDNDENTSKFQEKCRALGIDYFKDKPVSHPDIHKEIVESWKHLLDYQWCTKNIKNSHKKEQMAVCIQHIHPKWVENTYILTPRVLESYKIPFNSKTSISTITNKSNRLTI
jgi:hypothetical protein